MSFPYFDTSLELIRLLLFYPGVNVCQHNLICSCLVFLMVNFFMVIIANISAVYV